jgi:hypothetical protein
MLDRASLTLLAAAPEKNAPALNAALAEEGDAEVRLALLRSSALDGETLRVISARAEEGGEDLDAELLAHPRAPAEVRDRVLARHREDPGFVWAAATHPAATEAALEAAARWPSRSTLHDRPWLARLAPEAELVARWASDPDELLREAAARLGRDAALLGRAASDGARRVRRALAENADAELRARLAAGDPAVEVRARASSGAAAMGEPVAAMGAGGVLAEDTRRALREGPLDAEAARLAGEVLPESDLARLVARSAARPEVAAGLALRGHEGAAGWVTEASRALARAAPEGGALVGKARLAAWLAEGLAQSGVEGPLAEGALARDVRVMARVPGLARSLCEGEREVPGAALARAWSDDEVADEVVIGAAARLPRSEVEIDLDPAARSIAALSRAVLAGAARAAFSARAALLVTALDARRVRYLLAAMPGWARLSGAAVTRVLRQNAGALRAGAAEPRPLAARVEEWTERPLAEAELGVALAIGHLTAAEAARRIEGGRLRVEHGAALAEGMEVRAALEGAAAIEPLRAWAEAARRERPAALSVWILVERASAARLAGALSALEGGREAVPDGVCEALARIERRRPGRLGEVRVGTARARALLASGLARAYRDLGGRA